MKKTVIILVFILLVPFLASCGTPDAESQDTAIATQTQQSDSQTQESTATATAQEAEPQETEPKADIQQASGTETVFQGDCPYDEQYEIWDISQEIFPQEILKELGADGFSGTDAEIAQQIFDWQAQNMVYADSTQTYTDAGFGARWNMMLPGIYPASKRIEHKTAEGKVYGICSDFAYIYCAIAKAYKLECKVTTYSLQEFELIYGCMPEPVMDYETYRGLGREEYDLLNIELQEAGVELTYDQVYRAIQGVSTLPGHVDGLHRRAEVLLDGEWVSMDATKLFSYTGGNKDDQAQFTDQNWDGIYNPIRLYAPEFQDSAVPNAPIDYEGLALYLTLGRQVEYPGITDDFGNEDRVGDFNAFVRGDGYLPYVATSEGLAEFLNIDPQIAADEEYGPMMAEFYEATGRPFNIIADFLIYEDGETDAETYVRIYNGITGDSMTLEEFYEFVQ